MSYQTTILVGKLGADPETDYTASGTLRARFSVAVNRSYTSKDGQAVKETAWFRITAWGKQAEACNQYLHKGDPVLVEGRLSADPQTGGPRLWTRQDGSPAASFDLNAETVRFLSARGATAPAAEPLAQEEQEIPF